MAGYDKMTAQGVPFHGEFSSADASAGTLTTEASRRIQLYLGGASSTYALAASDQVIVTEFFASSANPNQVTIYEGSDVTVDAGDTITYIRQTTVGGGLVFGTPHFCRPGCCPKVVCGTTVVVDVTIRGVIKLGV